ncbi:MAG TPA: hypothetical protein VGP18_13175 [Solirubrobacteraceae bacterium]|nr:hypothetical protein [Solirubrobacteraceae bacterium]
MTGEEPEELSASDTQQTDTAEAAVGKDRSQAAVDRLNAIVEEGRQDEFFEITECSLGLETTEQTYGDFARATWLLTGEYSVAGVLAFVCQADGDDFSEMVDPLGFTAAARQMVLELSLRYGHRILAAWYQSARSGHVHNDWVSIVPNVQFDVETGEYVVTVAITKKNRERTEVIGGADSMIRWLRIMLGIVIKIGDASAFSERDRDRIMERLDAARTLLAGESAEEDQASDVTERSAAAERSHLT